MEREAFRATSRTPRRAKTDALLAWAEALLFARAENIAEVIETGLRLAAEQVDASGAAAFQMAGDTSYVEVVYQWRRPELVSLYEARYHASEIPETFAAFRRGEPVVVRADDPKAGHPMLRAVLAEQGSTGTMAFPIQENGVTSWVLVFEWRDAPPPFAPDVLDFGQRTASLLRAGLAHAEQLTSQAEAQRRMLERQKLETLGVMAGGIVHDFNNVLQAVLGLSEMLKAQLPPGSSQELAGLIGSAATRAADLTHRFLVFSRHTARDKRNIHVTESLSATLQLLRRSIPENRRIRLTTDGPVGSIYMAPIDFEQAIVNLCHNASAAMPAGGTIEIECRAIEHDGSWIEIVVRDDGVGMTPEQLARACDLFYTTKPPGEGTGLGLPMVKRTVEAAGGQLSMESEPGRGTTVRLLFPKSTAPEVVPQEQEGPPITGHETILVVEDDPFVRRVAATQLQKAGFTVIQAPDGERALALYRKHRDEIAAVLTDVIMPGMGGVALYEAIAAEGTPPPFLFASGYDAGTLSPEFLAGPDRDFLTKPYPARQMLRRLRQLLDARAAAKTQGGLPS